MTNRPKVMIACDGACSPNPGFGGWAAILTANGSEKVITGAEPATTNNRMELMAAVKALSILTSPCDVTIHTDSQYLAQAFNAGWLKGWQKNGWVTSKGEPVKNDDLWRTLLKESDKHTVTWSWVRGHNEHPENERCDQLAVEARLRLAEQGH